MDRRDGFDKRCRAVSSVLHQPVAHYIETFQTSLKIVICSKIAPNLTELQVNVSCQYMEFG
jgi:hypothetical protein